MAQPYADRGDTWLQVICQLDIFCVQLFGLVLMLQPSLHATARHRIDIVLIVMTAIPFVLASLNAPVTHNDT